MRPIFLLVVLTGCAMNKRQAARLGHPECEGITRRACEARITEAQRAFQLEQDKERIRILVAGSDICKRLKLTYNCFSLVDLPTLEKGYGDELSGQDKVAFEMARTMWAKMEDERKETARNLATMRSGSTVVIPVETVQPAPRQKQTNCMRFGNMVNCNETSY